MSTIFSTTCYACGNEIFGNHNRRGGVFYVDDVKHGIYHRKTCKSGYFNDATQSGSVPIPKHIKINDENQFNIFPESKLCRLCWNTNGWVSPSGWEDKAKPGSYEHEYGFGHEEWLFDMDKVLDDGYHYGFLEPVNKFHDKYVGRAYNFVLYTIVGTTQQKYLVGKLCNAEVINKVKAKEVTDIYAKNGWLDFMKKDLFNCGLNTSNFDNMIKQNLLFNIRFKPEEFKNIYKVLVEVEDPTMIDFTRYVLRDFDEKKLKKYDSLANDFDYKSGSDSADKLAEKARRTFVPHERELPLKHNILVKAFLKYLKAKHGDVVRRECRTAGNRRVDLVLKSGSGFIFYEVKTYNHLETSLRVAIGQLIEYSCYPERMEAKELYLVSDIDPREETVKYIKHLNKVLNIKFGYVQFDAQKNEISKVIS